MNSSTENTGKSDAQSHAWRLLLAARRVVEADFSDTVVALHYNPLTGEVVVSQDDGPQADLRYDRDQRWQYGALLCEPVRTFLDLYLPVLASHANPAMVVGHLGQSVDARIATIAGDAFFVTGEENRTHLHRMRALCHAVLVGAETVAADNPQLTTRAVAGPNPIRVVLDPVGRVGSDNTLLNDAHAPTWLVHNSTVDLSLYNDPDHVKRLVMQGTDSRLDLPDVVNRLSSLGIHRLFVEGGGVTVTGMLTARCLHRVQIAVAPCLVGEGRPALQLPGVSSMRKAMRPPFKLYRMGEDVLWDFDVNGFAIAEHDRQDADTTGDGAAPEIERLL